MSKIKQELEKPFEVKQLHWRVGATSNGKGIALAYIDARDVMKRLDDVVGSFNWQSRYTHMTSTIAICEIGIQLVDEWVWKSDGAGDSNVEAEKGRISDAFKRTAVHWGIARYLYKLPNVWVPLDQRKRLTMSNGLPVGVSLPVWATPEGYSKIMEKKNEPLV